MKKQEREKAKGAVPTRPVTPGSTLYRLMELVAAAVAKDREDPRSFESTPSTNTSVGGCQESTPAAGHPPKRQRAPSEERST